MRRQILIFLLFTFSGAFASTRQSDAAAVTCTQFMAWTAGGMSSQRLMQLSHQRGISFILDTETSQSLLTAGADPALLENLRSVARQSTDQSKPAALPGPAGPRRRVDSSEEISGSTIHIAEVDRGRSCRRFPGVRPWLRSPAAGRLGPGVRRLPEPRNS